MPHNETTETREQAAEITPEEIETARKGAKALAHTFRARPRRLLFGSHARNHEVVALGWHPENYPNFDGYEPGCYTLWGWAKNLMKSDNAVYALFRGMQEALGLNSPEDVLAWSDNGGAPVSEVVDLLHQAADILKADVEKFRYALPEAA